MTTPDLVFLSGDEASKVLVVMVNLRGLLVHLGQLLLDSEVLADSSLGRVGHHATRRLAELTGGIMHALNHLLLHSAPRPRRRQTIYIKVKVKVKAR